MKRTKAFALPFLVYGFEDWNLVEKYSITIELSL